MTPLLVVEPEEAVEILLELLHRGVELLPVRHAEELLLERPVEALDHSVRLGRAHSGGPVLDLLHRAEAELASCSLAALEIDIKPLLVMDGPARVRLLSSLRREVAVALEFRIPVVVSSGVGEDYLFRMPRDLASVSYLFGLTEKQALDAVSANPVGIVLRNREKLSSRFVAPGISIVKEGRPVETS